VTLSLDVGWLSAFLLAMVRATAWLFIVPPFASVGIPVRVRLGLALALGLFVAPWFPAGDVAIGSASFIPAVVYQAGIGLVMGFGVLLLVAAAQAAGGLIDFAAGFSAASVFDPVSNVSATPFGRLFQLTATAILFASGGHRLIMRGFLTSFAPAAGPDDGVTFETVARILGHNLSTFFAASLQMAVPLVASLFLAEVAMGLLARSVPQMNIISLAFGIKTFAAIVLGGLALAGIPAVLYPLVSQAADTMVALGR
jgi:flagellar biosynthesis protein FliR